jgi:hypothetical protein
VARFFEGMVLGLSCALTLSDFAAGSLGFPMVKDLENGARVGKALPATGYWLLFSGIKL